MKTAWGMAAVLTIVLGLALGALVWGQPPSREARRLDVPRAGGGMQQPERDALRLIEEGRQIFRHDTFGDEAFWGDALKLHLAVAGEKLGGVGPGVSPKTALEVGLKVDQDALPADVVRQLQQKQLDLNDPATTLALLKLNAVVGVKGVINERNEFQS